MNWLQKKLVNLSGIDKFYGTINGQRTRFEIDGFSLGHKRNTHYPDNFRKYVEIYKDVYVVQNVIGQIGKLMASADFVSENNNDALVAKLNNPNDKQSKEEFLKEFTAFIKSAGWVIIWKKYVSYGNFETMQLINLDPDKTEFTDTRDVITEYEEKEERISKADVIVLYDTIRLKNNKGYSSLKPLRSQVNNILDGQIAKGIQIQNSGTTIVSPKAVSGNNVIEEGINAIVTPDIPGHVTQKQQIEEKLSGRGLSNRFIVSSKGLDAVNLGAQLNAVDFTNITESDILAICSAFGVDVELTPYGKNATFENKQVAELSLVQKEVSTLANNLLNSLISEFPTKGQPVASFAHLDCMSIVEKRVQETNTVRIEQVQSLLESNLIDTTKAKELLKDIIG